jgi:hypothetical protein
MLFFISKLPTRSELSSLHPFEQAILHSMIVRNAYGGMGGDMSLIRVMTRLWFERFRGDLPQYRLREELRVERGEIRPPEYLHFSHVENDLEELSDWSVYLLHLYGSKRMGMSWESMTPLRKDDIPLSAVDMHCSKLIPSLMSHMSHGHFIRQFFIKTYLPLHQKKNKTGATPHGGDLGDANLVILLRFIESATAKEREERDQKTNDALDAYVDEQLRMLIWECRSSRNVKKVLMDPAVLFPEWKDKMEKSRFVMEEMVERMMPLWSRIRSWINRYAENAVAFRFRKEIE